MNLEEIIEKRHKRVHTILAYSYLVYFVALLAGLFFDFLFPVHFLKLSPSINILGVVLLVLASILIFWAQSTSSVFKKNKKLNKEHINFFDGPYRLTRTPTNWGLFFLMVGFGLVNNTFYIIFFACLAWVITKLTFLKIQEKMLEEKYGERYLTYKKTIRI